MTSKKLIAIVLLLSLMVGAFWFGIQILNAVKYFRYYSAMSWLNLALRESLETYYKTNNTYPEKLTYLKIAFPGDNATPEMLDKFIYSTDGSCYEINYDILHGKNLETYKENACKGKLIYEETYIDNKLYMRNEYSNGTGTKRLYEKGRIISEKIYKDGKEVQRSD